MSREQMPNNLPCKKCFRLIRTVDMGRRRIDVRCTNSGGVERSVLVAVDKEGKENLWVVQGECSTGKLSRRPKL